MSKSIVALIDHALLHPTMTEAQIREGCEYVREMQVASACVKPHAVPLAAEILAGSGVAVSTVVGFPHGANLPDIKVQETRWACEQGASEVDMVANIGWVLGGQWDDVHRDIQGVVDMAHSFGAITKVIFETDFLPDDETKIELCQVCERAGAEFVKTSTGFGFVKQPDGAMRTHGATEADVRLMRANVGPQVQVKASGGIRSFEDAQRLVAAGATRLGTSATAAIAAGQSQSDIDY